MDLFAKQWVVLSWPIGLLGDAQRDLLEQYLISNFDFDVVRFEAAPEGTAIEVIGSAQGVVRGAVLRYIQEWIEDAPTTPPFERPIADTDDE